MEIWIIVGMIVALLIVGIAVFLLRKDKEYETDYRIFFILGVTWIPLGIATKNYAFLGLGIAFMVLGLSNRDKWKDASDFSEMPEAKRRMKMVLLFGLVVLLGVSLLVYLMVR